MKAHGRQTDSRRLNRRALRRHRPESRRSWPAAPVGLTADLHRGRTRRSCRRTQRGPQPPRSPPASARGTWIEPRQVAAGPGSRFAARQLVRRGWAAGHGRHRWLVLPACLRAPRLSGGGRVLGHRGFPPTPATLAKLQMPHVLQSNENRRLIPGRTRQLRHTSRGLSPRADRPATARTSRSASSSGWV